jgi:hypothetical protein
MPGSRPTETQEIDMSFFSSTRLRRWGMATVLLAATAAWAQAWPSRPVKIIVPYTVGGA